ncbi:hypothetical protein Scep_007658 [Stephania cephalantha]|uniref:Uncharacterized protein n=1 Tax=Stephania cephalantha TaxID=152367 RepID=A0AAP0PQ91_9MAGN
MFAFTLLGQINKISLKKDAILLMLRCCNLLFNLLVLSSRILVNQALVLQPTKF